MNGKIYLVKCLPTGQNYIGQTRSSLPKRMDLHFRRAEVGDTNNLFHAAIRKYGRDAFEVEVLHYDVKTQTELDSLENACIIEFNAMRPNGLNTGRRRGSEHHFFGKSLSPEHREKIASAKRGKRRRKATRQKISRSLKLWHKQQQKGKLNENAFTYS